MAGYTRQSVADIIANAIIKAAPVNAEFNTIRDAFAQATGHAHDGTSAEGAYVPLISDPNAFNKVVIDSGNNRISFYNDVSSVAVEQVRIEDGVFVPVTDNDVDLGAAGAEFKDLYIDGVGYIDTLAVHENATVVGTLGVTGLSTLATVDINGGNIDGTVIGASSAAAGGFTTVTTSGQAALTSVNIDGGAIDGTTVGITVPAAGAFTTLSSTTGITGDVTGNVTGNLTGNSAGVHTGAVTGDVTGNITAATGSSSFNNVTINGSLDMNSVSSATVTGLSTPVLASDAATKGYVDGEVAALVDAAPGTLDTLNELAAALGDDPNYAATTAASIATKLPLAGGTMTGAIAMGTSKITGMGDPTAAQDAATKAYSDTQDALKVTKAGDTMSGALAMGSNQITGLAAPTLGGDATNKTYVDAILGSATAASASAAAAAVSEANAATSETNAATSESNAATSEANAAASYDSFDDRYLGAKATAPTVDNDGDALIVGALYFNNTTNIMNVYGSGGWQSAGSAVNGTSDRNTYTATAGQTVFAATYDTGYVDVYLNGVKLVAGTDFTATNGTSITLTTGAAVNDVVDIVAYGTFVLADHYTEAQSDARYVNVTGDTMTGNLDVGGTVTADGLDVAGNVSVDGGTIKLDGNYPVGSNNVALGDAALDAVGSGGDGNTALGSVALTDNTTGDNNTAIGYAALYDNSTASANTAVGASALEKTTTGADNSAVGFAALLNNTTGSYNSALGRQALRSNTTASNNTAVGYQAGYSNTTGTQNVAIGAYTFDASTSANYNTAVGAYAMSGNTTGNSNVAFGNSTLGYNTTGANNTALGSDALKLNTTASNNTAVGYQAGFTQTTGHTNTNVGVKAGYGTTTGIDNTYIGPYAGIYMTTGSKNVIIGRHSGNFGGLDIRTSSNNIVLSDGDGNPRGYYNHGSLTWFLPPVASKTTAASANVQISSTSGALFRSTSSLRYKNTVSDATHGLDELLTLRSVTYKGNDDGDEVFGGLIAEEVHDAGLTEFVEYDDQDRPDALRYANMVSLCIKAIQEQQATITALEARITALENA